MALKVPMKNGRLAQQAATTATPHWRVMLQQGIVLFKLRIVFLLLVAATGGAFLAAEGWPGFGTLLLTWLTGGMAAAGASALNQYWERDSDGAMGRTDKRPLVTGAIEDPRWVPYVATALILLPSIAVYPFNPALTFFLLLGAVIMSASTPSGSSPAPASTSLSVARLVAAPSSAVAPRWVAGMC